VSAFHERVSGHRKRVTGGWRDDRAIVAIPNRRRFRASREESPDQLELIHGLEASPHVATVLTAQRA
jgi:hypothetical protein